MPDCVKLPALEEGLVYTLLPQRWLPSSQTSSSWTRLPPPEFPAAAAVTEASGAAFSVASVSQILQASDLRSQGCGDLASAALESWGVAVWRCRALHLKIWAPLSGTTRVWQSNGAKKLKTGYLGKIQGKPWPDCWNTSGGAWTLSSKVYKVHKVSPQLGNLSLLPEPLGIAKTMEGIWGKEGQASKKNYREKLCWEIIPTSVCMPRTLYLWDQGSPLVILNNHSSQTRIVRMASHSQLLLSQESWHICVFFVARSRNRWKWRKRARRQEMKEEDMEISRGDESVGLKKCWENKSQASWRGKL